MEHDSGLVSLSNVKFISSTRNREDISTVKRRLQRFDGVVRDIVSSSAICTPRVEPELLPIPTTVSICNRETAEVTVPEFIPGKPHKNAIPLVFSIQYTDQREILHIMQALIREELNEASAVKVDCAHCNSTDVLQTNQLAKLSAWRKQQMEQIAYPTRNQY